MLAVGFLGTLGLALGLISLIYPLRFIGIRTRARAFWLAVGSVAALIVAGENGPTQPETARPLAVQDASSQIPRRDLKSPASTSAPVALPSEEARLLSAVATGIQRYRSAENEMQQGASRPARAREICSIVGSLAVNGWVGTIGELSTNGDGKGVLSINLSDEVVVRTTNNSFSDTMHPSLIDPASELFASVSRMRVGDRVSFSGRFFRADPDCIAEISLTLRGSITNPNFLMRFTRVERMP